jgi:2-oxoglutarate dehydrogenase E1 component
VAQPIIDQFIVSGQAKWGQTSNLVLRLPHGYEGQGPEHSSARLERFLQLAAHENIRVANPTTAAQYFHLLRSQELLVDYQRPLVVMTPKSLLRHQMAYSTLKDLSEGSFQPVLDDGQAAGREEEIERLVLCSGRIFTELAGSRERQGASHTALGRLELLYPFPEEHVRELLEGCPNLQEIVWVQEEPMNMGAWTFLEPRIKEMAENVPVHYVGKPSRPSPAQGSPRFHQAEHTQLVAQAFASFDKVSRIGRSEVRHAG